MQRQARMKRELEEMTRAPPHGISCWAKEDCLDHLEAQILGGDDTPYSGGVFKLEVKVPERYPFQPPQVRFITPIYHPNIDNEGRICLDRLKMPPSGSWKPVMNIGSILTTIQLLMCEPNPNDPLMTDIAEEFKFNKSLFKDKAAEWTRKYAMADKKMKDDEAQNDLKTTKSIKRMKPLNTDTVLQENVKKSKS